MSLLLTSAGLLTACGGGSTLNTDLTTTSVAPVITSTANQIAQKDFSYSYDVNATDANSADNLTYELTKAPTGMSINAENGVISWKPTDSQIGTQAVTVKVTDDATPPMSSSQSFDISVSDVGALNISNTMPANYVWDTLENGKQTFVDRSYIFEAGSSSQVNSSYTGLNYLRTAKADRTTTGNSLISFEVNIPVTVFVAHENVITNKPGWLNSWSDTGDDMGGRSIYRKDFNTGTITLGGNKENSLDAGSMYFVFINPRILISGTNVLTSTTNGIINIEKNNLVNIDVSDNAGNTVSLNSQPTNGTVIVIEGNILQYTPDSDFSGNDTITFTNTDANGNVSVDTLTVTVSSDCTNCRKISIFDLYWDAVNNSEAGYRIYYGDSANSASTLAYDLPISQLPNPQAPSTVIRSDDLGLQPGDFTCFRIKTYNNDNSSSAFSGAACTTI